MEHRAADAPQDRGRRTGRGVRAGHPGRTSAARDAEAAERDRRAEARDVEADQRDAAAAHREARADQRERVADAREAAADRRDDQADRRDRRIAAREAAADVRDRTADARQRVADARDLAAAGTTAGPDEASGGRHLDVLSDREREILGLIAGGASNKDIAATLYISVNTVKSSIRTAYRKIGVTSRTRAVLWYHHGTTDAPEHP